MTISDPDTHRLTIPEELAGQRLDVVLARLLPQYSRSRLQRWIDESRVTLDGEHPARRTLVRAEQQLEVAPQYLADDSVAAGAPNLPFSVVHRDAAVLVIDKPAGLVVHPGAGNRSGTLQNALLELEPALAKVPRAGIVHRLDKDTAGAMLVARTPQSHAALVRALAAREIGREYLALCHGALTGGGTISEPIGRHRTQRVKMAVRPDGREAVTHYRIERRLGALTLVRVQLETGRTHQIRVHLSEAGHPLLADGTYGGDKRDRRAVEAVRAAAPGMMLTIDANEGWSPAALRRILPLAARLDVAFIEQPTLQQYFDSDGEARSFAADLIKL